MATAGSEVRQWWTPRRWYARLSRMFREEKKHPFDRVHGTDTGGLIYADRMAGGHAHASHNAGYYATAPSLFHEAIALWRKTLAGTGYVLDDYTLVDIGCGKGRVLLLASEYAFREIVGGEIDPGLARIGRKNLQRWQRGRRVPARFRILEGDALDLPLPDGPVVLFYFNSFERAMMEMWLARLADVAQLRTAPLDLIYLHPEFDALVRHVQGMRVLAEAEILFSKEDAKADVFGVTTDACAIYRLS